MNNTINPQLPGLTGRIVEHLRNDAYISCDAYLTGGALATMSTLSGARYVVQGIDEDEPHVVYQGAMLLGPGGTGKGCTITAVETLLGAIGDRAFTPRFSSWQDLWHRATETPGVLWIKEHEDHHKLAKHELTYERDSALSKVLNTLQMSARYDCASLPLPKSHSKQRAHIRPSPVTILAESKPEAFQTKLESEMAYSEYFGELLLCVGDRSNRRRGTGTVTEPSPELRQGLRYLAERRGSGETVQVGWADVAYLFLGVQLADAMVTDLEHMDKFDRVPPVDRDKISRQVTNIAALLAIGVNPERPIITLEMAQTAFALARTSFEVMLSGLDVEPSVVEAH